MADPRSSPEAAAARVTQLMGAKPMNMEEVQSTIVSLIGEDIPLTVSRKALDAVAENLQGLDGPTINTLANFVVDKITPRVSFEEHLVTFLESLAAQAEKDELWTNSARLLSRLPLESGNRTYPPAKKADIYIRIAQLFLEDGDSVSAETFINRAATPIADCQQIKALQLRYKVCYARILDSKRKFMEAAPWYYRLSLIENTGPDLVSDEELLTALAHSITCAILAPAGPARSRILAMLNKDERSSRMGLKYSIMKNMFFHRILPKADVEAFAQELQPHQLAKLGDGSTVLDRAVTEHNLLSVSKIYANIKIDELGALLQVSPEKAESVAAAMIAEKRMKGTIDQVEGILSFDNDEPLQLWSGHVEKVCQGADTILDQIVAKYPQLA